ncbi:ArnT family glycosyltransferase [Streptomyces sp. NPDC001922]|uniref:ArnT family glycosyltransferase n=1 Tax=Streptomyces sp. NPDC001922 TaxID=3364624 RepID=UPI003699EF13
MTERHDETTSRTGAGAVLTPPAPASAGPPAGPPRGRLASAWRGRAEDPRWVRPAFLALLLGTLLLYLWNLQASGWANSYYSAAVQAGSESWKAFFFGSLDAGNAITVDKPPAALWPMALSVRLFGLHSWAVLVPEVLMGVAAVAVLHGSVRRSHGPVAGLLAGGVLALTPVAALMFRFNNPDALLALLMTVTVACVLRAMEGARTGWLLGAGAAVGLAFLTKTLQAFLVLPPLALLYAVCAPTTLRRRLGQLLLAGAALVVAAGWWVAAVELWPAGSRPYVGGSQSNSFMELTLGYNGLGRINGEETGSVGGGGGPGGGAWGRTGIGRMFGDTVGGQISWLLPAALILLVAGLLLTRRAGRTDPARAAFLAWGGSLVMTLAVFSFMAGIFHEYYTVALAPYLAAVVGMGVVALRERRRGAVAPAVLGGTVAVTALWAFVLLGRNGDWLPWLRWTVLAAGLAAAAGLAFARRLPARAVPVVLALGLAASLAGPLAYTLSTVGTGHTGSIVTAGPAVAGRKGPGGGMPPGMAGNGRANAPGADGGNGAGAPGRAPGGNGAAAGGAPQGMPPGGSGPGRGGAEGGVMGGLLGGRTASDEVADALRRDSGDYTWAAATVGAQNAAGHQLATGSPVMAIGGFNGSDPSPTLAQFKKYVRQGRIHYFVPSTGGGPGGMPGPGAQAAGGGKAAGGGTAAGGRMGAGGGAGAEARGNGAGGKGSGGVASSITQWVKSHYTKVTVDGTTLYDLTRPTG